jgi:histone deacetylase 1/2
VDDLFLTGSSPTLISWIKQYMHQEFDMQDLGRVQRYLGLTFEHTDLGTFLHQRDYTASILQDFTMEDCKPAPTPFPDGQILTSDMHSPPTDITTYCKLIGKLIFLTVTRPDIAFSVSRLSSYMASPQLAHLEAAKHLLRYLQGTLDMGILYRSGSPITISGFTDADWGSCTDTRRSMGAYIFTLAAGPITWQSKKQLTVSRSSTESEYRALSDGAQEGVWLHRLLQELQYPSNPSTEATTHRATPTPSIVIFCDNQSAIKLSHNPVFHAKSKHIEIHYHFIRERVLEGEIELKYIHTDFQPADALTKSLSRVKFHQHRTTLGLHSLKTLSTKLEQIAPPTAYTLTYSNPSNPSTPFETGISPPLAASRNSCTHNTSTPTNPPVPSLKHLQQRAIVLVSDAQTPGPSRPCTKQDSSNLPPTQLR